MHAAYTLLIRYPNSLKTMPPTSCQRCQFSKGKHSYTLFSVHLHVLVLNVDTSYFEQCCGPGAEFLVGGGREPAFRKAKKQGLVSGSSNKHEVSLIYDDKYNLKFKIGNFFRAQNKKICVWRRSNSFLPGADPIRPEPESAPEPRTSGDGTRKKSGGSTSLIPE